MQMRFPTVICENKEGKTVTLPDAFEAPLNLVLISFQEAHNNDVQKWNEALPRLCAATPKLHVYEIRLFQALPIGFQSYNRRNHRLNVPEIPHVSHWTSDVDLNDFNRALNILTISSMYAIVVDALGNVLACRQGQYQQRFGNDVKRLASTTHYAFSSVAAVR